MNQREANKQVIRDVIKLLDSGDIGDREGYVQADIERLTKAELNLSEELRRRYAIEDKA